MAVRRIMSYLSKRALPRQGQDVRVEAGGDLPVHEDPVWQNATRPRRPRTALQPAPFFNFPPSAADDEERGDFPR